MSSNGKKPIVISNGTLIDGTGNVPTRNEAIVIQGNRIKSAGRLLGDIKLEDRDSVEVIDAAGQWIMPGLIDAHTHLSYGNPKVPGETRGRGTTRPEFNTLRAAWNARKVLRSGVTSISVPGGTWFTDVAVRDAIKLGLIDGPRVYCAGRMIVTYGSIEDEEPSWVGTPEHSIGVLCNTAAEMVTEARRQCKHGVNFVKMADSRSGESQTISKEEIAAVVSEAHRRNVRVAIHSRGSASTRAAAEAGVDWIMHTDLATEADLEAVAKAGVRIVPTVTFVERVLEFGREVGQEQIQIDLDRMKRNMDGLVNVLQRARAFGIKVLCGTDTGNYSWMPYGKMHAKEAEILVRYGGYTTIEAITACTRDNAFAVGLENEVGVLEGGKLADVIILKQNPVADIRVLQEPSNLAVVIKDGKKVNLNDHASEEIPLTFQEAVA
ncbi:MAG: amidohydrolase family protein [Deltaproteobacteria bacterium]|nr:MAG: amidohydrolase family protein [Deltaproteobacteria bacterium]